MSSPNDTNINVKFTVSASALKRMFEQLRRLQTRIKGLSKNMTQLNGNFKRLGARFDTTNSKVKKFSAGLKKQSDSQERARRSMQKLVGQTNKYGKAVKGADRAGKRGNTTLGFTGLAFGFIGGIAGFAASQIRNVFNQALEETAAILSEVNRISLFSDVGIIDNVINLDGFNNQLERTIDTADRFGLSLKDAATLLKEVEKAAPSNIDTSVLADITAGFAILEKGVNVSQLVSDFSTIAANFQEIPLGEVADFAFAFSKATKLSFSAGSKTIAFAAQAAKRLNTDLTELGRTLAIVVAAVPGDRGTAGRSIRRFVSGITDTETIAGLEAMGVTIFDTNNRFVGLESIILQTANAYNKLDDANQRAANAFLEGIGLTENAKLGFLAFADASEEVREAVGKDFDKLLGDFAPAVENQSKQAEESLNRLKNTVTRLKLEFTQGLVPALGQLNLVFKDAFADTALVQVIRDFGSAIGESLVTIANIGIPILKAFGAILKGNEPLVKALGAATVGLVGALTGMSIIFPLLGGFFALIFLHEKLIERFTRLGKSATLVTKAYGRMNLMLGRLKVRMVEFIASVRSGDLSLKSMNVTLLRSARNFKAFVLNSRVATLAVRIFSIEAFKSLALVARGWLLALGPIALVIGAIIVTFGLMRVFQDELVGVANKLDSTGNAGKNFKENMDGLFDFLATGDLNILLDPLKADLKDTEVRFGILGEAWNTFISDLGKSKVALAIQGELDKITTWLDSIPKRWDEFVASLTFELDKNWAEFMNILGGIDTAFTEAGENLNQWLTDIGFDMPGVWADFDQMLIDIKKDFEFITKPITDFLDSLDFEIPDVWGDFLKILDDIAKHPIVAAGLEILGIFDQFGKNIARAFEDAPNRGEFQGGPISSFFPSTDPASTNFIGPPAPSGLGSFGNPELLDSITAQLEEANVFYVAQLESLDSNIELLDESNQLVKKANPLASKSNVLQNTGNLLGKSSNTLVETENSLREINSVILENNTDLLKLMNENLGLDIIEVIRNFNHLSALTTTVALTQVMFANLIAQGERAAGKLASLRVSPSGKFSISDPGISSGASAFIGRARFALSQARSNQVNVAPIVNIEINPVIQIADGTQVSAEEAAENIVNETTNQLQKNAALIALQ